MKPSDFIATAKDLVQASIRGRPRETNLRRAISTTYYALFHCIALCCADSLVGGSSSNRSEAAWQQAYRALQHRQARNRCQRQDIEKFPIQIQNFANLFVRLQQERHRADYAPYGDFYKDAVVQYVADAEYQLSRFAKVPLRDRRAFAIYVLMDMRGD